MNAQQSIIAAIKNSSTPLSTADILALNLGERTYISHLLTSLVESGQLIRTRSGRTFLYSSPGHTVALDTTLTLVGLHEEAPWHTALAHPDFSALLTERTSNILYFAFTEILNNAIDHSHSGIGYAKIWHADNAFHFIVRDKGIGAFRNFASKKRLPDIPTAIGELIKGKQTTAPRWHSGEGIFWTSKIADKFTITSYDYRLLVDNTIPDYSIQKLSTPEQFIGTEVYFEISDSTTKSLQNLFQTYALDHTTYSFDTTAIPIKLFQQGDVWVSRSQAKRILQGLDKYQKIILDFSGIELIGQGFADEIFRVFHHNHPHIILEPIHMSPSVQLLVNRALHDPTK